MKKSEAIRQARKAAEKRRYDSLVLSVFDQLERSDNRQQHERAAKMRRKARNAL